VLMESKLRNFLYAHVRFACRCMPVYFGWWWLLIVLRWFYLLHYFFTIDMNWNAIAISTLYLRLYDRVISRSHYKLGNLVTHYYILWLLGCDWRDIMVRVAVLY